MLGTGRVGGLGLCWGSEWLSISYRPTKEAQQVSFSKRGEINAPTFVLTWPHVSQTVLKL